MKSKVIGAIAMSPYKNQYNGYVLIHHEDFKDEWNDEWGCNIPVRVHGGWTWCIRHGRKIVETVTPLPEGFNIEDYVLCGWDYLHAGDTPEEFPREKVVEEVLEVVDAVEAFILQEEQIKMEINKVEIAGTVGSARVVNDALILTVATNQVYTKDGQVVVETTWHKVVAWGVPDKESYTKGTSVHVEGRLRMDRYTSSKGLQFTAYEIVATSIKRLNEPLKYQL